MTKRAIAGRCSTQRCPADHAAIDDREWTRSHLVRLRITVKDREPTGATEVRRAARAFIEMKSRVERTIEQRTTMLAGVSHDLRTPLTRMRLELAMLGDNPETKGLADDISEMERMIEGYLAFARGEGSEAPTPTGLGSLIAEGERAALEFLRRRAALVSAPALVRQDAP